MCMNCSTVGLSLLPSASRCFEKYCGCWFSFSLINYTIFFQQWLRQLHELNALKENNKFIFLYRKIYISYVSPYIQTDSYKFCGGDNTHLNLETPPPLYIQIKIYKYIALDFGNDFSKKKHVIQIFVSSVSVLFLLTLFYLAEYKWSESCALFRKRKFVRKKSRFSKTWFEVASHCESTRKPLESSIHDEQNPLFR